MSTEYYMSVYICVYFVEEYTIPPPPFFLKLAIFYFMVDSYIILVH